MRGSKSWVGKGKRSVRLERSGAATAMEEGGGGKQLPSEVLDAVLRASDLPQEERKPVAGYDFNHGLNLDALLRSLHSTGFQAAHLGQAIVEVNRMVRLHFLSWRTTKGQQSFQFYLSRRIGMILVGMLIVSVHELDAF